MGGGSFPEAAGQGLVLAMADAIRDGRDRLCALDGAIGDGDHGINMNKGFALCRDSLLAQPAPLGLSASLQLLSTVLMGEIGGSMGPLYGMFFRAMARGCQRAARIDAEVFLSMLEKGETAIGSVGQAQRGDKTLLDCLGPAVDALRTSVALDEPFAVALARMKDAAADGVESTRGMRARIGRASRLGERSVGHVDAGAASCCLLLTAMADAATALIEAPQPGA